LKNVFLLVFVCEFGGEENDEFEKKEGVSEKLEDVGRRKLCGLFFFKIQNTPNLEELREMLTSVRGTG